MIPIDLHLIKKIYKNRNPFSHKGTHGHALLIAGSSTKMGAGIIAARACLRSGVGLLTVVCSENEKEVIFNAIPEAMISTDSEIKNQLNCNVIGIGSGIGVAQNSLNYVYQLYDNQIPVVFDADALNLIATHFIDWKKFKFSFVLTPHPKEFDRLFGTHLTHEARIETAVKKALELNTVMVLKSHQTIITDGHHIYINTTGNAGLAKGGSGDALTGMITSFIAQGYSLLHASILGVYLHGLAADITLETQSEESMLISDVIQNIGKAFKQLS